MKKSTLIVLFILILLSGNLYSQKITIPEIKREHLYSTYPLEFYEMMGMLSDYRGRTLKFTILIDIKTHKTKTITDRVESFYPNEKIVVDHFISLINKIEKKGDINFDIKIKKMKSGHITIYSQKLASLINSFYVVADRNNRGVLHPYFIHNNKTEEQFAYLKGAYKRYGRGNSIIHFNSISKAELIYKTLKRLGYRNVKKHVREGYIPTPTTVSCNHLHSSITGNLEQYKKELRNVNLDDIDIAFKRTDFLDEVLTKFYQDSVWTHLEKKSIFSSCKPLKVRLKTIKWLYIIPGYEYKQSISKADKIKNYKDLLTKSNNIEIVASINDTSTFILAARKIDHPHNLKVLGTSYGDKISVHVKRYFTPYDKFIIKKAETNNIIKVSYFGYAICDKNTIKYIKREFQKSERKFKFNILNNKESLEELKAKVPKSCKRQKNSNN